MMQCFLTFKNSQSRNSKTSETKTNPDPQQGEEYVGSQVHSRNVLEPGTFPNLLWTWPGTFGTFPERSLKPSKPCLEPPCRHFRAAPKLYPTVGNKDNVIFHQLLVANQCWDTFSPNTCWLGRHFREVTTIVIKMESFC